MDLELSEVTIDALGRYVALLEKWNRTMNLVSRKDMGRVIDRHLLDSLSVIPHLTGTDIVDIGSGAGLPGIPLAIVDAEHTPARRYTLIDRMARRTRFLAHCRDTLSLDNVSVLTGDAGELESGAYDMALARAVATGPVVWDMVHHALRPSGQLLVFASTQLREDGETTQPEASDKQASEVPAGVSMTSERVAIRPTVEHLIEIYRAAS